MRIVQVRTARVDNCILCQGTHEHITMYAAIVQTGPGAYDADHEAFACPNRDYQIVVFKRVAYEQEPEADDPGRIRTGPVVHEPRLPWSHP